jgi:hypothetical protein
MNLISRIQKDLQQITTNTGGTPAVVPVIFSVTDGTTVTTATVNAIAVKHHLTIDPNSGEAVVGKNIRVTVSEKALVAANYPVRNNNNCVSLINHNVTWTDISGVQATYTVNTQFPDEITGSIVLFLADYATITPPGRLIIGWIQSPFTIVITNTPNPSITQTLANGDTIPVQYALNTDGTLTIPYMAGYTLLEPFFMDNSGYQNISYIKSSGTFNGSAFGGFSGVNVITFNASIPIWQS